MTLCSACDVRYSMSTCLGSWGNACTWQRCPPHGR